MNMDVAKWDVTRFWKKSRAGQWLFCEQLVSGGYNMGGSDVLARITRGRGYWHVKYPERRGWPGRTCQYKTVEEAKEAVAEEFRGREVVEALDGAG